MSRLLELLMCATLMCAWAGVASAFTYNFKANSSEVATSGDQIINGSFKVTVQTFTSSETVFTPDQLDSFNIHTKLGSALSSVTFYMNGYAGNPNYDVIQIKVPFGPHFVSWNYYFDQEAFTSIGNYKTVLFPDQVGHLHVTGTTEVPDEPATMLLSSVPEPASMLLLGLGLVGLVGARRNFQK